jgi:putative Mg2+ transporter-C (MgtC) family protein
MTGIGFLGTGVIFKEGLTVRGLTTAASIWITSGIGILIGIGFWFAAIVGAIATLVVLALFRFVETRLPSEFYAHHMLRFQRDRVMSEDELRKLVGDHGFTIANLACRLTEGGQQFEYRMTIKSRDRKNGERLAAQLRSLPEVIEFRISPTGD